MGLDHADALILQWFSDFSDTGKMKPVEGPHGGPAYQWVLYQSVIDDLPCLGITNREVMARRFKKLCNSGILEYWVYRHEGTFTCFRKGQYFSRLLYGGVYSKVDRGSTQKSTGVYSKVDPKTLLLDSSTKLKDCALAKDEEINTEFIRESSAQLLRAWGINPPEGD